MKCIKTKYLIIVLLAVVLFPLNVAAKEKIELKVDKTDLTAGDKITVTATATKQLDAYSLIGTLKYDKNVFEKISNNNFSTNENTNFTYNKDTLKFGIINKTGKVSKEEDESIFNVHLKVKEDANVGDTNIALTNISYSDGNNKKYLDKASVKVLVTRDAVLDEALPVNMENLLIF